MTTDAGCIFCGGTPLTKQHPWGKQLIGLLPPPPDGVPFRRRKQRYDEHAGGFADLSVTSGGSAYTLEVRCVCGPCNALWMNALETAARPVLALLARGRSRRLGRPQQRTLATWAAMVAMVAEFVDAEKVAFTPAQRRQLMQAQTPPTGTTVLVASHSGPPNALQSTKVSLTMTTGTPVPGSVNTQATTILFGHLVVVVFSSQLSLGYQPTPEWRDRVLRIWPDPTPVVWSMNGALTLPEVASLARTLTRIPHGSVLATSS
jgi:hypothetical protein